MTTVVADVRSVIDAPKVSDADITALIATADQVISKCSVNWTVTQTDMIRAWVTAHLLATGRARLAVFDKLGDAQKRWDSQNLAGPALGLFDTAFGRQALLLDDTGCLSRLGKQQAFATVL